MINFQKSNITLELFDTNSSSYETTGKNTCVEIKWRNFFVEQLQDESKCFYPKKAYFATNNNDEKTVNTVFKLNKN